MKLSELTYDYLCSIGLSRAHLHTDTTDVLYDVKTSFCKVCKANEEDIKNYFNID